MAVDATREGELREVFFAFASFGASQRCVEMEGKNFIKLCKDARLLSKCVTSTDIDLIFTKAKPKGARKITFDSFITALDMVAEKKGCSLDDVVATVLKSGGPENNGTQAEAVKWHDDKSLYTGVYANGGPTNVDMDPANLASICDRSSADVRGVKTPHSKPSSRRTTMEARRTAGEVKIGAGPRTTGDSGNGVLTGAMKDMKL